MPCLPCAAAVARGLPLPRLRPRPRLETRRRAVPVLLLPTQDVSHRRHLFAGTRIGLRTWFAACYVVNQTSGVSALGLQRVLRFGSYETAWGWLHTLRRVMVPTSGKLRGAVKVDEVTSGALKEGVTGERR